MPKYHCQNCNWSGTEGDPVEDAHARFTAGDLHTDTQCPECGALAYPGDGPTTKVWPNPIAERWSDYPNNEGNQNSLAQLIIEDMDLDTLMELGKNKVMEEYRASDAVFYDDLDAKASQVDDPDALFKKAGIMRAAP